MKPMEKVYYLRLILGIVAAFVCLAYGLATGTIRNDEFPTSMLFNGMSLAIITYLISYNAIKAKFKLQVQKPQKLFTTGIGVFFLSWLVFWILLFTTFAGPGTVMLNVVAGAHGSVSPSGTQALGVGQVYIFNATAENASYRFAHWEIDGVNQTTNNPISLIITFDLNNRTLEAFFTPQP
jgi:hypothetical protein